MCNQSKGWRIGRWAGFLYGVCALIVAHAEEATKPSNGVVAEFWDTRAGIRTQDDPYEKQTSLAETRLRLILNSAGAKTEFHLSGDLLYDAVAEDQDSDLEAGTGLLDLREAAFRFRPASNFDVEAGRQIISWGGRGELLSINDRFPKDFRSFFLGRDISYLKAPTDAVKFTLRTKRTMLDVVYSPRFDADRFIDGSRLSIYNPGLRHQSGNQNIVQPAKPDNWFEDDEVAVRLSRPFRGGKGALYYYRGFWKSPAGFDPRLRQTTFPRLAIYGASLGGKVAYGRGKTEIGYYDSLDDPDGDNPLVRNSEIRFSVAYGQRLSKQLTLGAKYYLEHRQNPDKQNQPQLADKNRQVLSTRITQFFSEDVRLMLIAFYSTSDKDGYLRPSIDYRLTHHWALDGGANWFFGESEKTTFGQFKDNSNVYMGLHYRFF